ncbi:diaminopropionate ammonia-lyase [Thalassobacillus cyri]|uniref:Diaminopropionate ammonia-lyase n=1 Tax=Thalassobacillus cyri TaxID=571932 RepID=A0A1H4AHP5_9BACI|nr:diaminopropionate ammonia-lyase [Thalassobacillus cyri]SEA35543.1 diaminopropionate ammonia-lyase [Thalassobacillus cyri]
MQKTELKTIQWTKNNFYSSEYNQKELRFFQQKEIAKVHAFQKTHGAYTETPLFQLNHLAQELNVAAINVKDESYRFGLNAFKVMGGIYAMAKCLADKIGEDIENLSFDILKSKKVKEQLSDLTFISATDGNHGRGVAWAARELGYNSVIYMPKGSSKERLEAIRNEGATADITDLNYDDAVRFCADLAEKNNWIMVQDTAWEGYDEIPLWIMQGYAAMAKEITDQLEGRNEKPPTHVFLQAGVGSFAGGIAAYLVEHYREEAPTIVVVEPHEADCYYRSFASPTGERELVTGDMDTIMAGLACGEPNTRAFRILKQYASAAFSCADQVSALGMRIYSSPLAKDPRIISGESGAVTLGLLHFLRKDPNYAPISNEINLDEHSRVLLISTEGDTDAKHYRDVVWKGHYPNL